MTSPNQRPVVTVLISGLNLPKWVPKSIFAQVLEVVTGTHEVRSSEIDRVVRRTRYANFLGHVGLACQRAHAASFRADVINLGLVDHAGTEGPGVVESQRHGFHRFGEVTDRHHIVVYNIFAPPGVSAPEIHIGLKDVIDPACRLIIIRWNANYGGVIVDQ